MKRPVSSRPTHRSRILRAAVTMTLMALATVAVAAPAQAAAFRFWGYFQLTNGAWAFAQTGPAQVIPKDGSVEGWRFAVADETSTRNPRVTPTFDSLCAAVKVAAGTKRVGLVIDYGRPADSADSTKPPEPRATCVAVPEKATGSDVLVAADATLRVDKALTCAIDGWPATSCGEAVDPVPAAAASPDSKVTIAAPTPSASATPGDSATPAAAASKKAIDGSTNSAGPFLLALAALIVVAGLGFAAWRRGREVTED